MPPLAWKINMASMTGILPATWDMYEMIQALLQVSFCFQTLNYVYWYLISNYFISRNEPWWHISDNLPVVICLDFTSQYLVVNHVMSFLLYCHGLYLHVYIYMVLHMIYNTLFLVEGLSDMPIWSSCVVRMMAIATCHTALSTS